MANAANVHVFHVEFGLNDTVLTRALEDQNYTTAERLILENAHTSFLDEGCYQRTPLYIILCGTDAEHNRKTPINFYLAKMLIQHGASVNLRVPETHFGSEYMSPGKSSMELLTDFYISKTSQQCNSEENGKSTAAKMHEITIGTKGDYIRCEDTCLDEICELMFIMLAHGGNPNIEDEHRMTLLHRATLCSDDVRLLQLLASNGGNVNAVDIRGNSPFLAMCDRFPFGEEDYIDSHEVDDEQSTSNPYLDCSCVASKNSFVEYFLSLDDVDLDLQNKYGRTALFNCMVRGDITTASLLLKLGCDVTLRGKVKDNFNSTRFISPLFTLPCSSQVFAHPSDKLLANRHVSLKYLYHHIDMGLFTVPGITKELQGIIEEDFFNFRHLKTFGHQLLLLLFGGTTATLRQHCVRTVFQRCFLLCSSPSRKLFLPENFGHNIHLDSLTSPNDYLLYLTDGVTVTVLERLIKYLQLPKEMLMLFEVELFRELLINKLSQFHWFKFWKTTPGMHFESDSDEDTTSDEDESDLEYW